MDEQKLKHLELKLALKINMVRPVIYNRPTTLNVSGYYMKWLQNSKNY